MSSRYIHTNIAPCHDVKYSAEKNDQFYMSKAAKLSIFLHSIGVLLPLLGEKNTILVAD
jgi:hypothetical protein